MRRRPSVALFRNLRRGCAPAALLAALAAGCSSLPEPGDPNGLAWPPGNPRVRLEQVIVPRGGSGAARFFRRVAGRREEGLLQRPYAAAWDRDELLITDPAAGRVLRIDVRGRVIASSRGFDHPVGVAVCPPGVVVSDSRGGRVALLAADLRLVAWLAEDLERPTGVACDERRIFVVETARHRVLVFEPRGGARETVKWALGLRGSGTGEFNFPTAVALSGGSLWVGDTLNFRLQRFDAESGAYLGSLGQLGDAPGEMPRIKGVAVDGRGQLWVSDAHLDQVSLHRVDGTFLMAIGNRGNGPGEFSFPAGVAAHADGRVAVVDSLNRRVQIFRLVETPPTSEGQGR